MTSSVKLFEFIQKFHQTLGIYPPQPNQKQSGQINLVNKFFIACCTQLMFTNVAFLAFEAESMFSYGLAFFVFIAMINGVVIYLTFIFQIENTLKYIENCEGFIAKSKKLYIPIIIRNLLQYKYHHVHIFCVHFVGVHSADAYKDLIGNIELFNKLFCYSLNITYALLLITAAPYTYIRYYILDMGTEAFQLFCPSWFVLCIKRNRNEWTNE